MKRIGRPLSDNPKNNVIGCKLTNKELRKLELFCTINGMSKSEVLRNGIKNIIIDKE